MTKQEAIDTAIPKVKESGITQFILRRGDKYSTSPSDQWAPRGWKIVEMISKGNVHAYEPTTPSVKHAVEQYAGEHGCRTFIKDEDRVCMAPETVVIDGRKYCDAHRPADVTVYGNAGDSVFLVRPRTDRAKRWMGANVSEDAMWSGEALAVEHRYVEALLQGMAEDGLKIEAN